jgi:Secretion system C-terminal sorting domain
MRTTICSVFQYISGIIGTGQASMPVNIEKQVTPEGAATASGMYPEQDCGIVNTLALQMFTTGQTPYPSGTPVGYIKYNFGLNWHKTLDPIVPQDKYDLYTATLHEALHMLGFASLIGHDGEGIDGLYSRWDTHLRTIKNFNFIDLIQSSSSGQQPCCDFHEFNSSINMPNDLSGDCNIRTNIRDDNFAYIAPVNDYDNNPGNDDNAMRNKLSHLEPECTSFPGIPFVIKPEIDEGEDFRELTLEEERILSILGFPNTSGGNSCVTIANDDIAPNLIVLAGPLANPQIEIPVLINDTYSPNYTTKVIPNSGNSNGGTVGIKIDVTFFNAPIKSFIVKGLQPGIWTFSYEVSGCNGWCSRANVTVTVIEELVPIDCAEDCNLVCYGDYEGFIQTINSSYFQELGLLNFRFNEEIQNTPDLYKQENGNKLISFFSGNEGNDPLINFESIIVPLREPILPGCTAKLNFDAASSTGGSNNFIPTGTGFSIFGLTDYDDCKVAPPAGAIEHIINYPTCAPTGSLQCSNSSDKIYCIGNIPVSYDEDAIFTYSTVVVSNLDLMPITEFVWTNPSSNEPITHLIIHGIFDGFSPIAPNFGKAVTFALDNLSVTTDCGNQITVMPKVLKECTGTPGSGLGTPAVNGEAIIEYTVCLTGPGSGVTPIQLLATLPYGFSVAPGGAFTQQAGLATATVNLTQNPIGTIECATVTLNLLVAGNIPPGTVIDIPLLVNSTDYCTNTTTNNPTATLHLQSCIPDPEACLCPNGNLNIGYNSASTTFLFSSAYIPKQITGGCLSIKGKLVVDTDFTLEDVDVIMNSGAEIVVQNAAKFTIKKNTNINGCNNLWRSITIESGGTFISDGKSGQNTINDALHAVRPLSGAKMAITYTQFDRNYIGIYTAPTPNGGAQSVTTTGLAINKFLGTAVLKAPFDVTLPPTPRAYAMAELNNTVGIDFQQNNVADGLANGLIANRSSFTMDRCTIKNPLQLATYPIQQRGVFADNCANVNLTFNWFEQNKESIYSTTSNINADHNTIVNNLNTYTDYFWGIIVKDGNGRITKLSDNTINTWGPGIMVSNCKSPVSLGIRGNTINLQVGAHTPLGGQPSVPGAAIDLDGCDNGIIWGNNMYNKFSTTVGDGLFMNNCNTNTVAENKSYSHFTGYRIDGCTSNYFYGNDAVREGKANRTGFEVSNSVNTYCTNYTDNQTQEGWYFSGACTPSAFSCNQIVNADYGLFLAEQTEISPQNKRGNQWLGAYGSWGAYHASTDANLVIKSQFSMPAVDIPTWATASGSTNWFLPFNVATNCNSICPPPDDVEFGGHGSENYGNSEADIRAAKSEHSGVGMNWMGQQRLYQRLQKGISETQSDSDVQTFYGDAGSGTIGQLNHVAESSNLLLSRDNAQQAQLAQLQKSLTTLNAALMASKEAGAGAGTVTNWENQLRALQGQLLRQMNQFYGHDNWIKQQITAGIPAILTENANITTPNNLADNEKIMNTVALENGFFLNGIQPNEEVLQIIKTISDQCPLEGGFAVYEARGAYRRFFPNTYWDDRNLCSKYGERTARTFHIQQTFVVQPNPANEQFMVRAAQPTEDAIRIDLYYATGQLVSSKWIYKGTSDAVFSTTNLPNGIYIYRINTPTNIVQTGKIVIAH